MAFLVSFQQLRDWRLCPQLYAFRYVQKIPEFLTHQQKEKGQNLHRLIERDLKGLNSIVPKNLSIYWENYQKFVQELRSNPCICSFFSEFSFLFFIENVNQRWGITGRIDLLIIYKDRIEVIDWKIGAPSEFPHDIWQMEWYAWCIHQIQASLSLNNSNNLPIQARCNYLSNGENIIKLFESEDLKRLDEEFRNHIAQMDIKEYALIPTPYSWKLGNWCNYCSYQQVCPEGKHCHERVNFTK